MDAFAGVLPVIGTGPLDGFAVGILASGACFVALTTSWRSRKSETAAYDIHSEARQDASTLQLAAADQAKQQGARSKRTLARTVGRSADSAGTAASGRRSRPGNRGSGASTASSVTDRSWRSRNRGWRADSWPALKERVPEPCDLRPSDDVRLTNGDPLAYPGDLTSGQSSRSAQAEHTGYPAEPNSRDWAASAQPTRLQGDRPPAQRAPQQRLASAERVPQGRPAWVGGHRAPHPLGDPTFGSATGQPQDGTRHTPRHAAPAPRLGDEKTGPFKRRSLADSSRN
jgi:hypothetical protein